MLDAVAGPMAATPKAADQGTTEGDAGQEGADHRWVAVAVVVFVIGWLLFKDAKTPAAALAADMGLFALLYVMAQAIERVLEPVASVDPFKIIFERKRNRKAAESKADPENEAKKKKAVAAQADLKRWKANRAVVLWALAALLGMWASSVIGVYVLDVVIETAEGAAGPDRALDVAVTGLVIGGGTKPLHDLISRVQASSTAADTQSSQP